MKKFRCFMQIAYSPNNALITVPCRLRGGCERLQSRGWVRPSERLQQPHSHGNHAGAQRPLVLDGLHATVVAAFQSAMACARRVRRVRREIGWESNRNHGRCTGDGAAGMWV